MFEHVSGFIQCCGCWFGGYGLTIDEDDWNSNFNTPREALAHLDIHEAAGHDIGAARVRIEKEYPDLDIEIQPYKEDPELFERITAKVRALYEQHPPQKFRDKSNGE
jgi:hypothetical protein